MTKSSKLGICIQPYFAKILPSIKWKYFDCLIETPTNKTLFQQKKVKAPDFWSKLAVDIAASRYFRKTQAKENSVEQMVSRVAGAVADSGLRQLYFSNKKQRDIFFQELTLICLHQKASFNSPVWFNVGLYESYGIKSPHSAWAWDFSKKQILPTKDAYIRPQSSACFIQSIEDSIEGIFTLVKNEAKLFKYGSGSGTNFSNLRSKFEPLSSGANSSGLMSFLEVLDKSAGAIKSGGTTRRAAKMNVLDIDHPEVLDFIKWKSQEEKKAKLLQKAGIKTGVPDGIMLSGQNANNSVRVTNAFMHSVKTNKNWGLRSRLNKKVLKQIPAKKLWDEIILAAWECADPGLQFHDSINKFNTCAASGDIRASNPCSEYMFLDDSACNLASINLRAFLNTDLEFDFIGFIQCVRVMLLAQDILVDHSSYPTEAIASNSHRFRPLGLGFTGLGAILMEKGIPYTSEEARLWAAAITALMSSLSYDVSSEIAESLGPFQAWSKNKNSYKKCLKEFSKILKKTLIGAKAKSQHANKIQRKKDESIHNKKTNWAHIQKTSLVESTKLLNLAMDIFLEAQQRWIRTGLRNAQLSLIAPTGTISFIMDSQTTGIEPEYSLVKTKRFTEGRSLTMVSESLLKSLKNQGYAPVEIDKIIAYIKKHGSGVGCPLLSSYHQDLYRGALEISWQDHLSMMLAVQPFLSGAISKTINLPEHSTLQTVHEIYWEAWEQGLKAISVYRDTSKSGQPLSVEKAAQTEHSFQLCPMCGSQTSLEGGCWRCNNCGHSLGCS